MRIYELFEQDTSELTQIANLIKTNCQPYLRQVNGPFSLVRGVHNLDDSPLHTQQVRLTDRIPRAMSGVQHKFINEYFVEHFGEPFRNAAFVLPINGTSLDRINDYFGEPYYVFPKGQFTFCWSPTSDDLNYKIRNGILIDYPVNSDHDQQELDRGKERLTYILDSLEFQTTDLQEAILSGNEIMIRCNELYLLNMDAADEIGGEIWNEN